MPVIKTHQIASVREASAKGTQSQHTAHVWTYFTQMFDFNQCWWVCLDTPVMIVVATDDDQQNTPNSQIFYSIAEQSNSGGMFRINPVTGQVFVERTTLDREVTEES